MNTIKKRMRFGALVLLAVFPMSTQASTILLNTGDAWSSAIPADFNNVHTTEITSTSIVVEGVAITLSSTGGVLEHFLNAFGVGSAAVQNNGELDFGESLSFSFSEPVTLTSYDALYWDGGSYSYTIGGKTYNDSGNGTKLAQTTDSFTLITFNQVGGNGGFSNVTFATVPEPSSAALLGLGGLALVLRRRR